MTVGGGAWSSQKRGFDAQVQEKSGMGINAAAIYNHANLSFFRHTNPCEPRVEPKYFTACHLACRATKLKHHGIELILLTKIEHRAGLSDSTEMSINLSSNLL